MGARRGSRSAGIEPFFHVRALWDPFCLPQQHPPTTKCIRFPRLPVYLASYALLSTTAGLYREKKWASVLHVRRSLEERHPADIHLCEVLVGRGLVDQLVHLALHGERQRLVLRQDAAVR